VDLKNRRFSSLFPLLTAVLCLFAAPAGALVITLRSGNGVAGGPDALIRQYPVAGVCGQGYATPFTAAEFTAALSAPPAVILSSVHPAWTQGITCDPAALWVGTDAFATPMSVLYALEFNVPDPCCIQSATLDFCWSQDDALGDTVTPDGVFLNQTPIPAISGGGYTSTSQVSGIDVTGILHCGTNTLHIYNRDLACAVSGIIFSATLKITECTVAADQSTWSNVKALYQD
jgi:hypothetical protein